eukprot:GEMP01006866.1.p1 GENE.GEMP01006866.1~~GEMP01006866.1.p1  ORF type:complete len:989 (+),score=177.49 GEMP01006866.1:200-3166(+)
MSGTVRRPSEDDTLLSEVDIEGGDAENGDKNLCASVSSAAPRDDPFERGRRSSCSSSSSNSSGPVRGYASFPDHQERRGSVVENYVPICNQAQNCCGIRTYVLMFWLLVGLFIMMFFAPGVYTLETTRWEVAISCTSSVDKPPCIECVSPVSPKCRLMTRQQFESTTLLMPHDDVNVPWSYANLHVSITLCYLDGASNSNRTKHIFNGDNYCSCGRHNKPGCKRYIRVNERVGNIFHAYIVINGLVLSGFLIVLDRFPSYLVRFVCAALFGFCGVISTDDIFYPFGKSNVITLALVCVICACLPETFQLERPALACLRIQWPESFRAPFLRPARLSMSVDDSNSYAGRCAQLLKMAMSVFPLRLVLPYNDVLIPSVLPWSRKLRMSESNVMLCMYIFASFAACMTPLGGPANIILSSSDPRFGFFTATNFFVFMPTAILVSIAGTLYLVCVMAVAPPISAPPMRTTPLAKSYRLTLQVSERFAYLYQTLESSGLLNLPGVRVLGIHAIGDHPTFFHNNPTFPAATSAAAGGDDAALGDSSVMAGGRQISLEDVTDGMLPATRTYTSYVSSTPNATAHLHPDLNPPHQHRHQHVTQGNNGRPPLIALTLDASTDSHAISSMQRSLSMDSIDTVLDSSWIVGEGDWISVEASAQAIARLRLMEGLEFDPIIRSNVQILGSKRGRRVLLEAALSPMSEMVGAEFPKGVTRFTMAQKAAFLTVRRPALWHCHNGGLRSGTFQAGDILLLEAFNEFEHSAECAKNFDLVRLVVGSRPPRHGTVMDRFRWVLSMSCMVCIFVFSTYGYPLPLQALVWGVILFATKVASLETARSRFPSNHLVEIVFSFGAAIAMRQSGISNQLANLVVWLGVLGGSHPITILGAFYILSSVFCILCSNITTCIFLLPVASELSILSNVRLENCTIVLLFSTHLSFITNTSIRNSFMTKHDVVDVDYSHILVPRDILRILAPLQLIMAIVTILSIYIVNGGQLTY